MLTLILFFSVALAQLTQTGNWCEAEQERNYEVVVSPRLEDSGKRNFDHYIFPNHDDCLIDCLNIFS